MKVHELNDCLSGSYCNRKGCESALDNCEGEGCESAWNAYLEDIETTINEYNKEKIVVTDENYKKVIKLIDLHEEKETKKTTDYAAINRQDETEKYNNIEKIVLKSELSIQGSYNRVHEELFKIKQAFDTLSYLTNNEMELINRVVELYKNLKI